MSIASRELNRWMSAATLCLAAAFAAGCGGGSAKTTPPVTTPQATAPALSVSAGTYATLQSVVLSDATAGAAIHYTTDGTTPTTSSPVYATPIPVATTTTIDAVAVASGYTNSSVASATYTIDFPAAPPIAAITTSTRDSSTRL